MQNISLTQGKIAIVDDCDFEDLSQYHWHAHFNKRSGIWYAARGEGPKSKVRKIMMHRHIFGLTDRRTLVDHWDHDGLNNRRYNLRVCSHSQNAANSRKGRQPTRSRYKGVSGGNWVADIVVRGRLVHLGSFEYEFQAAIAYNLAAYTNFGAFACVNQLALPPAELFC